jgi:ATP-dependent Clp protease adaptor protein ClpS
MATIEKTQVDSEIKQDSGSKHELILFNDDINTFDFVIDALVQVCSHSLEQAEQCTVLVHYKGKCVVKTGAKKILLPLMKSLQNLGLTASIK